MEVLKNLDNIFLPFLHISVRASNASILHPYMDSSPYTHLSERKTENHDYLILYTLIPKCLMPDVRRFSTLTQKRSTFYSSSELNFYLHIMAPQHIGT